jgi:probable HAF family extracellular repeat protein
MQLARNGIRGPLLLALLAVLTPSSMAQLPCSYEVDIVYGPACGDDLSLVSAFGISEEGDLCGDFECAGGLDHAYVAWGAARLTPLPLPLGTEQSRATDIENGRIVGYYALDHFRGFVHDGAVLTEIVPPAGSNWVEGAAINSQGVAVGAWGYSAGPFPLAFRWENGMMQDISVDLLGPASRALDINDNGAITGWMGLNGLPGATPNFEPHAFIWRDGKVIDLGLMPGSVGTEGWGINKKGQVCGIAWFLDDNPAGFVRRGFLWDDGVFTDLGTLPSQREVFPRAITDDGTIVGFMQVSPLVGGGLGFVWKNGVLRNIDDLARGIASVSLCLDINNAGEIAANGSIPVPNDPAIRVGVRLRPVPREAGDTNCDQVVDVDDLVTVILFWNQSGVDADVDGSGVVDLSDLMLVLVNWG